MEFQDYQRNQKHLEDRQHERNPEYEENRQHEGDPQYKGNQIFEEDRMLMNRQNGKDVPFRERVKKSKIYNFWGFRK